MLKKKFVFLGLLALGTGTWVLNASLTYQGKEADPLEFSFTDLSPFKDPGKSWIIAGDVNADLNKANELSTSNGTGVLVNLPSKKVKGLDLFTNAEFGDVELELDYLMSKGGNSGIYLQGRYEIQLEDSWASKVVTSASNGGIYNLAAPRVNASKAPGLWQHLKISFQAPRFDASGNKTENARILSVELNGVLVQENVELPGPTPGAVSNKEVGKAPLRIQGDHGAVAFKNIKLTEPEPVAPVDQNPRGQRPQRLTDPILVEAPVTTLLRSFMDLDDRVRVVHGISVGSSQNLHYTYDMDHGMLVQLWRGDFLDATPMWDGRGNGTALPLGAVQRFGAPTLGVAKLQNPQSTWPSDTTGTQYKPKGYTIDADGSPTFIYHIYGATIKDAATVFDNGTGLSRQINVDNSNGLYFRLAKAKNIVETTKGNFVVGDKEYYLQLDNAKKDKTFIRDVDGEKELIVEINGQFNYSIIL